LNALDTWYEREEREFEKIYLGTGYNPKHTTSLP